MARGQHRSIGGRRFWVRLVPKILGSFERVNLAIGPPGFFIRALVQLPVMAEAERHGELITGFEAKAARLRKSQMMRVARLSSADKTRLGCEELEMRLVTQPFWVRQWRVGSYRSEPEQDRARSGPVAELTMAVFARLTFFAAGPSTAHSAGDHSNATAVESVLYHRGEIQSAGRALPE
jgi:hypothetical protein